ncbi:MAG TPA: hypothetical protein VEX38_01285 [Fimbriimonadaceae bacterium]|nr:hypothetical protein [Fimbriimonadaceae bacterium]
MDLQSLLAPAALNFNTLPEQLLNGILVGAIYALIALGYTMVYGVLRLINFAHGEVYMLGAYVALFTSYFLGFGPGGTGQPGGNSALVGAVGGISLALLVIGVGFAVLGKLPNFKGSGLMFSAGAAAAIFGLVGTLVAQFQPAAVNILLMLLAAMIVCALVGVIIERFAYRPMRSHSRIAALITAIGVSLLLQYGGAIFLPNSPPPSIDEQVNPYRGSTKFNLTAPDPALAERMKASEPRFKQAQTAFDQYLKEHPNESRFSLSPAGMELRNEAQAAEKEYKEASRLLESSGVTVTVRTGQVIILVTTLILMAALTYLVLFTRAGRAMRAVSHDFDSASLMGINVNSIVTFTFILGSALAGAGAMMQATFLGTPLTTFYGLLPGVKAFVAAVLGGIGNIPGAVLGGLLMGVAEALAVWGGASEYRDAIAFVVLIFILLVKPGGLLGSAKVEKV